MEKVLFVSIPKCGTHLLWRYFPFVGFKYEGPYDAASFKIEFYDYVRNLKEGFYSAYHFLLTEELSGIIRSNGIKTVFLYRDPRAQICSNKNYILKTPSHIVHRHFTEEITHDEDRIKLLIQGFDPDKARLYREIYQKPMYPIPFLRKGPPFKFRGGINALYSTYAPWLEEPNCYCVRFEDLVGPKGGGSAERQLQVVRELIDFTGTPCGKLDAREIANALYNEKADTFHKGQIDSWREEFTPELHKIFMQEAGELLKYWGYPEDV